MNDRVMGIDPGAKGALALMTNRKIERMEVMPEDIHLTIDLIVDWQPSIIYLEKAQAMPGQGVSSMFKYGRHYGEIVGAISTLKIPLVEVSPRTWTKLMHAGTDSKLPAKGRSLKAALSLYPYMNFLATKRSRVPHDGLIDASLITGYGYKKEYNTSITPIGVSNERED